MRRARRPGICSLRRTRSTRSNMRIWRARTACTSRRGRASTWTASRSRRAWTSGPRRSTGADYKRTWAANKEAEHMKNFIQRGETLTLTAPYAVSSGGGVLVGSIFGVAATDVASGEEGEFQVAGIFDLDREAGASTGWPQGALIYWNNTTKVITKTATSNKLIGVAVRAAA